MLDLKSTKGYLSDNLKNDSGIKFIYLSTTLDKEMLFRFENPVAKKFMCIEE